MEFNTEEEIREMETELFLQYISEINGHSAVLSPSEKIALTLTRITSLYNQKIKKERGLGWWVCGTYMSNQRKNLTCIIRSTYSEEQLNQFIQFCCCKNSEQSHPSFTDDEADHIIKYLLTLRPEACVHPPLSYWRTLLDG